MNVEPQHGEVWILHCVSEDVLFLILEDQDEFGGCHVLELEYGRWSKQWRFRSYGSKCGEWERFT